MIHGWRVLAGWGLLLVALAAVEIAFGPSPTELALLGGAGAFMIALGLLALGGEHREARPRPEGPEPRALADVSPPAVAAAVGFAIFVVGCEFRPYLMFIGGGVFALGVGGLLRELLAERRKP